MLWHRDDCVNGVQHGGWKGNFLSFFFVTNGKPMTVHENENHFNFMISALNNPALVGLQTVLSSTANATGPVYTTPWYLHAIVRATLFFVSCFSVSESMPLRPTWYGSHGTGTILCLFFSDGDTKKLQPVRCQPMAENEDKSATCNKWTRVPPQLGRTFSYQVPQQCDDSGILASQLETGNFLPVKDNRRKINILCCSTYRLRKHRENEKTWRKNMLHEKTELWTFKNAFDPFPVLVV